MTIYVDEVFAMNTVSNILFLYAYCVLYRVDVKKARIGIAAALGGIYAVFDTVLALPGALRIIVLFIMVCAGFGIRGKLTHTLRLMFMSVCVEAVTLAGVVLAGGSVLVSGVITVFANSVLTAVIYFLAYPAVIAIRYIIQNSNKYRRVVIEHQNKRIEFIALYDSGNLLRYKGKPVITVGWQTGKELFEYMEYKDLERNGSAFVMYSTLNGGGILPVFENIKCYINGIESNSVMAVTNRAFAGRYKGIIA